MSNGGRRGPSSSATNPSPELSESGCTADGWLHGCRSLRVRAQTYKSGGREKVKAVTFPEVENYDLL